MTNITATGPHTHTMYVKDCKAPVLWNTQNTKMHGFYCATVYMSVITHNTSGLCVYQILAKYDNKLWEIHQFILTEVFECAMIAVQDSPTCSVPALHSTSTESQSSLYLEPDTQLDTVQNYQTTTTTTGLSNNLAASYKLLRFHQTTCYSCYGNRLRWMVTPASFTIIDTHSL